jgi:hypothetical protein
MIIYHGISFILLAIILLLVGMFKPKWILFWMDYPTRLMIAGICAAIFMLGAVLFGEGNKQRNLELQKQAAVIKSGKAVSDTPELEQPKPVAPAPPPAQAPTTSANDLRP